VIPDTHRSFPSAPMIRPATARTIASTIPAASLRIDAGSLNPTGECGEINIMPDEDGASDPGRGEGAHWGYIRWSPD
jgi:hypothetical protein